MPKKYRVTGFARFFVVMLFFIPAAYIGASYYNGEDGLENIKNLIGLNKTSGNTTLDPGQQRTDDLPSDVSSLQQELTDLKRRITVMERENQELKDQIFNKNEEIVDLQRKLQQK